MGTYINLMLNKTCIDFGKNNFFKKHFWLFPPYSKKNIEYEYAQGVVEKKEGFSANLKMIKFRMNNLGYSLKECKDKYNAQLLSWNRVNNLNLPFELLIDLISKIDLDIITDNYIFELKTEINEIRGYLKNIIERDLTFQKLNSSDKIEEFDDYYSLEDFILEILDVYILLRIFCENDKNKKYNLEWQYLDVVESGWVSQKDIEEFNQNEYVISHNKLYGNLHLLAINEDNKNYVERNFNNWLSRKGITINKQYIKLQKNGNKRSESITLPVYIRNIIHHPENTNNSFSDEELNNSITQMLSILNQ